MRHVHVLNVEDLNDKGDVEGDRVMVAEANINNISKLLKGYVKRG
jgi:hypothetical protein